MANRPGVCDIHRSIRYTISYLPSPWGCALGLDSISFLNQRGVLGEFYDRGTVAFFFGQNISDFRAS